MALQGDGKIVAVGVAGGEPTGFAVARYNPVGSLDATFSGDGKQTTGFGGGDDNANGVALQDDGKIVVVGIAPGTAGGFNDFALARYNPDGSLDTTFSGDGKQRTGFGFHTAAAANGVAIQGDGKIVVVGNAGNSFALARYNPDGSLDTSFSGDGKQTTSFGGGGESRATRRPRWRSRATARSWWSAASGEFPSDFALARYNPDGSLDPTFSGDGKQTTDFGGNLDAATAVALQANGKIVAVGSRFALHGDSDFALARYNAERLARPELLRRRQADDRLRGRRRGQGGGAPRRRQDRRGRQRWGLGGSSDFALARYNPNGSLDTTFSGDGMQTTDFGGDDEAPAGWRSRATARSLRSAEPTARSASPATSRSPATTPTARSTQASPVDGMRTTNFGGGDGATGVALQGDGKIIAVGDSGGDFALARYIGG